MTTEIDNMRKARVRLLCSHPFFGDIAYRLKFKSMENFGKIATDGASIFYDPEVFKEYSKDSNVSDEQIAILAHEIWHVVGMHHLRKQGMIHELANIAADYVTNWVLKESGFTLPNDALIDEKFADMTFEKAYDILYKDYKKNPKKYGNMVKWGIVTQSGIKDKDMAKAIQDIKMMATQAYQVAKMQGNVPAGIARFIDDFLEPTVDYTMLFRDYIEKTAKNDYNWTKPNRRYVQQGIYLPSLISDELKTIVFAIDTSGSIDTEQLKNALSNVKCVLDDFNVSEIHVVYIDAELASAEIYTKFDEFNPEPKGGGGTDFRPAFKYIDDNVDELACLLYFTDLMGRFPDDEPDYPVLWMYIGDNMDNFNVPFGEKICVEIENE